MAYLGRPGATAPLTSADIPDNSITGAKIVAGTIEASDVAADMATQAELDAKTLATLSDATVSASDPTTSTNPSAVGHLWVNSTSGESYVATSATTDWNVWTNIGGGSGNIESPYLVDFLVIAGGGGGSAGNPSGGGGGGGAGGYRNSYASEATGGGGSNETALTLVSGTVYTITVGPGGTINGGTGRGSQGSTSSISGSDITDITTVGGGYGGWSGLSSPDTAQSGGSGGSSDQQTPGGNGTANQGFDGAAGGGNGAGGGGGAGAVGGANPATDVGGAGGTGLSSSITGSAVTRGGGGGGSSNTTGGAGGTGGGGNAAAGSGTGTAGTANTGGGGGGGYAANAGGAGGSGVVILRIPTVKYSGTSSGAETPITDGAYKVLVFNGSGSYTA